IEQTQTKQRKCGRHSSEKKIFQSCFGRLEVSLVESGEDVKGQTCQLERNKNHQNVFGADQEHHSDCGQQDQGDILTSMRGEIGFNGNKDSKDGQDQDREFHELRSEEHTS